MAAVTDSAGAALERLLDIMRTLRAPDGCPWDREQTLASLRPFVLEETYEVLDAIEHGTPADLCEELGDFVFEAVFLAQISDEAGRVLAARRARRHLRQAGPPASPRVRARARAPRASRATRWSSAGTRSRRANGRWRAGPAQPRRRRQGRAERRAEDAAGAAARLRAQLARRHRRLRLGGPGRRAGQAGRGSGRGAARGAVGRRSATCRAPKTRSATCCSRWPTWRASSASSPSRRSAAPTRSSCGGSMPWSAPSRRRAVRSATPRSKSWKPSGSGSSAGRAHARRPRNVSTHT